MLRFWRKTEGRTQLAVDLSDPIDAVEWRRQIRRAKEREAYEHRKIRNTWDITPAPAILDDLRMAKDFFGD